jgi:hypothetical protein
MRISVWEPTGGFAAQPSGELQLDDAARPPIAGELEGGRLRFHLPDDVPYGWGASLTLRQGERVLNTRVVLQSDADIALPPAHPPARQGVVSLAGHAYGDANGLFLPLGITFFWYLGGLHRGDEARVRQHLDLFRQYRFDYIRILAQVNWAGEEIDPAWPDYVSLLGRAIDLAYDDYGLRTQVTVIGGGARNPNDAAAKVVQAVTAGRQHKIFALEGTNEGNLAEAATVSMTRVLGQAGVPFGVGLGNQGIDTIKRATSAAGANVAFFHTERAGDEQRMVRQAYDFKEFSTAVTCNEPPGPGSSVTQLLDPFKVACLRLLACICGGGAFVFHCGSLVYGRAQTTSQGIFRPANLWEVPGFQDFLAMVRAADAGLPGDLPNWAHFNDGWTPPNPTSIVSMKSTVGKHYGARDYGSRRWMSLPIDCAGGAIDFVANERTRLRVRHPITKQLLFEADIAQGERRSVSAGLWAYQLEGETL